MADYKPKGKALPAPKEEEEFDEEIESEELPEEPQEERKEKIELSRTDIIGAAKEHIQRAMVLLNYLE